MSAGRTPRVAIVLAPGERDALQQLAAEHGEPVSTTAARLVRSVLAERGARLEAARRVARRRLDAGAEPPWLPPAARADAIAALRDRYPAELRHLPADPLNDPIIAEPLAALTVWRDQLDDGIHADPRMEIAFAHELRSFAAWLQTQARRPR
jgi:lysophospholipase L1-like esterase